MTDLSCGRMGRASAALYDRERWDSLRNMTVVPRARRASPRFPAALFLALNALIFAVTRGWTAEPPAGSQGLPVITTIRQAMELPAEEAKRGYPVRLRAVVSGLNVSPACFLQDDTGAAYFDRRGAHEDLIPGQAVDVDGFTNEGKYSTVICERKTTVIEQGAPPPAALRTIDQLAFGASECQVAEIAGVVRSARYIADFRCLDLQVAAAGGRLRAYLFHPPDTDGRWLVDAQVRLRGVVSSRFTTNRQWVSARLNVDGLANVTVETPAPKDPFSAPAHAVGSLARYEPQGANFSHRVKVAGTVLFQAPNVLYLRDQRQPLLILTQQAEALHAGDLVEALGFLSMGSFSPFLDDAVVRKTGSGSAPAATPVTVRRLLAENHDAELISLEATLLETVRRGDEETLLLQADHALFNAQLVRTGGQPFPEANENGSLLRLTGICSVQEAAEERSQFTPTSFKLLLPSAESVAVVERPSWWTAARLLRALAAALLVVALGGCWIWLLRKRVAEQTGIILEKAQKEAVLEERTRLARDFHDSLEQELAGLAMQLDAVGRKYQQAPPSVGPSLDLARRMLTHCRLEARRSVWDLRCQALEKGDLVAGLEEVTQPIVAGQGIELVFEIEGDVRRLPGEIERDLLRIGQEAVTNAAKHGRPSRIQVALKFGAAEVALTVSDDGHGFDPNLQPAAASGHFGLAGMRERADKLRGALSLESRAGEGVRMRVTVPLDSATNGAQDSDRLANSFPV